jgi:hypothetical protein
MGVVSEFVVWVPPAVILHANRFGVTVQAGGMDPEPFASVDPTSVLFIRLLTVGAMCRMCQRE